MEKLFIENLLNVNDTKYDMPETPWSNLRFIDYDFNREAELMVVVGIGGSYMGLKACVEFLNLSGKVIFLGNSLDGEELLKNIDLIGERKFILNVISKSGETLETLLAFDVIEKEIKKRGLHCLEKYITSSNRDSSLSSKAKDYKFIELDPKIVGRYSTLAVGNLMFSFLGLDLKSMKDGFEKGMNCTFAGTYAQIRYAAYTKGLKTEILQVYKRRLTYFSEWWKQLFAESEGKDGKGLFVSSLYFTQDLHSIGQYLQEGKRDFLQTTLYVKEDDSINNKVNRIAMESTIDAHYFGKLPNILLEIDKFSEENFAFLIAFFQKSCVISSTLIGVNPYTNKGVNEYKKRIYKKYK